MANDHDHATRDRRPRLPDSTSSSVDAPAGPDLAGLVAAAPTPEAAAAVRRAYPTQFDQGFDEIIAQLQRSRGNEFVQRVLDALAADRASPSGHAASAPPTTAAATALEAVPPFAAGQPDRFGIVRTDPIAPTRLPSSDDLSTAWGGPQPSRWRPEAIIANAASKALNDAWFEGGSPNPSVADAAVSLPTVLQGSNVRPFGDGQTDAGPTFQPSSVNGTSRVWTQPRPPIVNTLVTFKDGSQELRVRLDREVPFAGTELELITQDGTGGWTAPRRISGIREAGAPDARTDLVARTTLASDSEIGDPRRITLIRPVGETDWYPVRFDGQQTTVEALQASVPEAMRTMRGRLQGASILDPLGISGQAPSNPDLPFDKQIERAPNSDTFTHFPNTGFHDDFPGDHDRHLVTSVGGGDTWLANPDVAPGFKALYVSFARRDRAAEASAPDGGVPSGAGWHRIGDPAETIVNSVSGRAIPVTYAQGNSLPATDLPSGGFANGLVDPITTRLLQPGEAFVVPNDVPGTDHDHASIEQPNFHTYWVPDETDSVPVVLWTHPQRPRDGGPVFGP